MRKILLAAALVLGATPALAQRQTDKSFTWEGRIPDGKWLILHDINGAIHVEGTTGDKVEVTATKSWRRGDPDDVRITVAKFGAASDNVVICALWNEGATCDEHGYRSERHSSNRNNDVSVEFTVRLPRGVRIEASTVNGGVRVEGATSEVEAHTVNGDASAMSSGGPVRASTVNGDIDVRMSELGTGDLDYSTVNGSVTLDFPDALDAEVDFATVNGSLRSDYPLTVTGKLNPRRMRATIGSGGRRLKVHTVNGSISLRKASGRTR